MPFREFFAGLTVLAAAVHTIPAAERAGGRGSAEVPIPPERATAAAFKVPRDFTLTLAAAELAGAKPVSVDWDARGRCWVALAPEFPFPSNAVVRGRIVVFDEVTRDGRFDKPRVFADGLPRLTSFVFFRDGVIVAQAPQIVWWRDTDGDGRADRSEVLFSGFGTHDPMGVINSFRWGLDGWIYAAQGLSGDDSESIVNARGRHFGALGSGVFRFKPDGNAIELVSALRHHCWGLEFAADGELFFATVGGSHVAHWVMPEKNLARGCISNFVSAKSIEDHQKAAAPLATAADKPARAPASAFGWASGVALYDGGAWPLKYNHSYFVCDPALRIVHEDVVYETETPTYEATKRESEEFLASDDPWFRPVQVRVGPDGAMYVLDACSAGSWPEAKADSARRQGRIWRLQHKLARLESAPTLETASPTELAAAFAHPNGWVRRTTHRLLLERQDLLATATLLTLVTNRLPQTRLHALWALHHLGALRETNRIAALKDPHFSVHAAALRIMAEQEFEPSAAEEKAIVALLKDHGDRVRLLALLALGHWMPGSEHFKTGLRVFPDGRDAWTKSAVLGLARLSPLEAIKVSFGDKSEFYKDLVAPLIDDFARQRDGDSLARVVEHLAERRAEADKHKVAVLNVITKHLAIDFAPSWSVDLEKALKKLLTSESRSVRVAALPLATRWMSNTNLGAELARVKKQLLADLESPKLKDEDRTPLITSLMDVPELRPQVLTGLEKLLRGTLTNNVQKHIITELGQTTDRRCAQLLVNVFPHLKDDLQRQALGVLLKRPESGLLLVEGLRSGAIPLDELGPAGLMRLRTHADPRLARRAAAVIDERQGPLTHARDSVVARFRPTLETKADVANGAKVFKQQCAGCHKFGREGKELGPDLTGAGLQGPSELLTQILDPNRSAEPRYLASNFVNKEGEHFSGLVARETKDSLFVKNIEGEIEIRRADLATQTPLGVSVMPDGFEMLGEKNLRDVIGYLVENTPKGFRSLELAGAFTADSRRRLFDEEGDAPSLPLREYGVVMVENIPFHIANPAHTANGKNLIVLRGGSGFAKTLPQRVEFAVGTRAAKIFFLGGVAGWGFPFGGEQERFAPAARVQLVYSDAGSEEHVLRNGEQFADYVRQIDVPGSEYAPGLTENGQLRWFSLAPKRTNEIDRIVLESFDNHVAPAFVALTAQVK